MSTILNRSLTLAMIIKNEATNLPRSLGPLTGLVDEMVVVDTGSTDDGPALATSMGAKVLSFEWIDDFAAARNFGLKHCQSQHILWLDADNSIKPEDIIQIKKKLTEEPQILLATEVVIPQGDRLWQKRVFPNLPEAYFSGKIHEQLVHEPFWPIIKTGVEINHWGYADGASAKLKGERNLKLLMEAEETLKGDFYYVYQTGRTLFNLRRFDEADLWLARATKSFTDNLSLKSHSLIIRSQTLKRLNRTQEAEEVLTLLVKNRPDYGPGRYYLGRLFYETGRINQAVIELEKAISLGTEDPGWGSNPKSSNFTATSLLGRSWLELNKKDLARRAFYLAANLNPAHPEPLVSLAEIALSENRINEAKDWLTKALELSPKHHQSLKLFREISQYETLELPELMKTIANTSFQPKEF